MHSPKKSLTLLELLIAITLLTVIALGVSSINVFSRFQTTTSSRREQVQHEVVVALEHMNKWVSRAIGNEIIGGASGANSVVNDDKIAGDPAIMVYIDANLDGQRNLANDYWIAYRLRIAPLYRIEFCPKCTDSSCSNCDVAYPAWGTTGSIIARNINAFVPSKSEDSQGQLNQNNLTVSVTGCWKSATATLPNGTPDNPCITMTQRISMPSVSTN